MPFLCPSESWSAIASLDLAGTMLQEKWQPRVGNAGKGSKRLGRAADEAAFSYATGLEAPRGLLNLLPVAFTAPPGLALPGRHPALSPGLGLPEEGASGNDALIKSDAESTSVDSGSIKSSDVSDCEETELEAEEWVHTQWKANASRFVPSFVPGQMKATARTRDFAHSFSLPSDTLSSEATQGLQSNLRTSLREAIGNFGSPHQNGQVVPIRNIRLNRRRGGGPSEPGPSRPTLQCPDQQRSTRPQQHNASEVADLDSLRSRQHHDMCFAEQIKTALMDLNGPDDCQHEWALQWVSESFWPLAGETEGCRLVQKAMEVGTPVYLLQLLGNFRGRVKEALQSPHGNGILQTFIEMVPSEQIQFIIAEMQGSILYVARHCFGWRTLVCLVKHCKPWQTEHMIKKVVADTASLCRHQFGNFILQHILQYGSATQRSAIADVVVADIISLSKHRLASQIVSFALAHCSPEDVERITQAVLHQECQVYNISRTEYGSFVVQEVKRVACLL